MPSSRVCFPLAKMAYSHDAREFAKEGRHIQNANRRAQGLTSEEDPPELAPSAYVDIPTLVVAMEVVLMVAMVVLQLLLPAAMVEVLMLILKVVPMVVMRVAPLMMGDGVIVLSTLFFSFLVLRCQRG
jgi:hypothetical protein